MSIEKSVLEKLLKLPVHKQKEVLAFVESLEKKADHRRCRRSLRGLWPILGVHISPKTLPRRAGKCGAVFPARMFDGGYGRRYPCLRHLNARLVIQGRVILEVNP